MRHVRTTIGMLAATVLLAGCGVSYEADLLASIEGRWMCGVQRYTFDDVGDIQVELDARLAGNGVSAEQYRAFKDDLTRQSELRDQVAIELASYCDTGS